MILVGYWVFLPGLGSSTHVSSCQLDQIEVCSHAPL